MQALRALIVVVAVCLALGACRKRDKELRGMTDSGFRLSGINWSDGTAIRLRYDGENRIERIEHGRGRYSEQTFDVVDVYYEYKYQRGRCYIVYYRCFCDSDSRWRSFRYNDAGRIDLAQSHAPDGTFTSFTRYRYDGAGRLAEARDSAGGGGVTQRIFNYGERDNLSSMTSFFFVGNTAMKARREWREYDTAHSYIHEIPGLPIDDPNLGILRGYISWTQNNYLTEREYLPVPENQSQTLYSDTKLSYRYDVNGLPVLQDAGSRQAKFIYERY